MLVQHDGSVCSTLLSTPKILPLTGIFFPRDSLFQLVILAVAAVNPIIASLLVPRFQLTVNSLNPKASVVEDLFSQALAMTLLV